MRLHELSRDHRVRRIGDKTQYCWHELKSSFVIDFLIDDQWESVSGGVNLHYENGIAELDEDGEIALTIGADVFYLTPDDVRNICALLED